jgi:hypothetical protein
MPGIAKLDSSRQRTLRTMSWMNKRLVRSKHERWARIAAALKFTME